MAQHKLSGAFIVLALMAAAPSAYAQLDLHAKLAGAGGQTVTKVNVACGVATKANCETVVPALGQVTSSQQVALSPATSGGSVESIEALCNGLVPAAVVQADAAAAEQGQGACGANPYAIVGKGLYPYEGYLIVSASNRRVTVDGLIKDGHVRIATGGLTSGGTVTMKAMKKSNPSWNGGISIVFQDANDLTLSQVDSGNLTEVFIMDAPGSTKIADILAKTDKSGRPRFKIMDVRPGASFYSLVDPATSKPLYQEAVLKGGLFHQTRTVSTPAVLVVSTDWSNKNSAAAGVLANATDGAKPAILSHAGIEASWAAPGEK